MFFALDRVTSSIGIRLWDSSRTPLVLRARSGSGTERASATARLASRYRYAQTLENPHVIVFSFFFARATMLTIPTPADVRSASGIGDFQKGTKKPPIR